MSRVQIDPDAAEAFGAAIHATAGELQTAVASLTDDVASLPPDAAAIAGADAVLSVTAAAAGRFAGETGELKDLLGLAAVLARRADYAGGTTDINDGVLYHRALHIGSGPPDMSPSPMRVVCAAADALGWVKYPAAGTTAAKIAAAGDSLTAGAQSVLAALVGRSGAAGAIVGSTASMGQLLCADTGYRGRGPAPKPRRPPAADEAWRDPLGNDGREDRHANPAGSTGSQMPDTFLGSPPPA